MRRCCSEASCASLCRFCALFPLLCPRALLPILLLLRGGAGRGGGVYQHEASRSTSLCTQQPLAFSDAQVDLALAEIEKGSSLPSMGHRGRSQS